MMDYIAGLVQRGLVSPDAAQGLVQQVADLKNRMPFESGGGAPTNSVYTPRGYGQEIKSSAEPDWGELFKSGKSDPQISKELGMPRETIRNIRRRMGNPRDQTYEPFTKKKELTPRNPDYDYSVNNRPDWFDEEMKQ